MSLSTTFFWDSTIIMCPPSINSNSGKWVSQIKPLPACGTACSACCAQLAGTVSSCLPHMNNTGNCLSCPTANSDKVVLIILHTFLVIWNHVGFTIYQTRKVLQCRCQCTQEALFLRVECHQHFHLSDGIWKSQGLWMNVSATMPKLLI